MHQLHQLNCQFVFVKICSDMESSAGFIKENQTKTEVIEWETLQIILSLSRCVPGTGAHSYCGYTCVVSRRHTGNSRFSTRPQWDSATIAQEFNPGLAPLSLAEKDQGCVSFVSLFQWGMHWARLSSTQKEHPIYLHELKTSCVEVTVELTSCCCCLHSTSNQA